MARFNFERASKVLIWCICLLAALVWPSRPGAAAEAEAIAPLFLGSLTGGASQAPVAADGMFAALAGQAASSIDVALYDFDRASVRDALIAARNRGVTVRVVGDDDGSVDPQYAPFYQSMLSNGIAVITDTHSSLMHNKFAVFDGRTTWTGSANFTDTGFTRNGENVVVITSTVVANIYATEFAEMFGGKFHGAKTDNTLHSATVDGSAVEVAFAPTDGIENRIIAALNSAESSVRVAMFTFTSAPLAQALIAAKNRGVAVEVLLDGTADGSQFSQRDPLCAAGVTVRVEDWAGKLHDKYAVVDAGTASDPLILTGSTNWTNNAVTSNDENLLIVHNADLAGAFASDFGRLRAAIGAGAFGCNLPPTQAPQPRVYLPVLLSASVPQPAGHATIVSIDAAPPIALEESVLIRNDGAGALDMDGWTLRDLTLTNVFTFPSFTLPAGAEVRVWTKSGADDGANLFWNRGTAVWNNGGDTAILRDAQGVEQARFSYP
jgi:phosphatidylserine/phosphatidylglycerophosphate/cardiolipin synthase-like enzyme